MSEYEGITGELREYAALLHDEDSAALRRIEDMCDAIDAVHAGLEKENAALKERNGWMELPKDADGEYVHVGDMLAGEKAGGFGLCEPFEVGCILFGKDIVQVNDVHGLTRCTEFAHHYVPDTWERIIEDALNQGDAQDPAALVARCRALCERTKGGDDE